MQKKYRFAYNTSKIPIIFYCTGVDNAGNQYITIEFHVDTVSVVITA